MLRLFNQLEAVEGDKKDKHIKQFTETVSNIGALAYRADKMLEMMVKADENWFLGSLIKMFK